MTIQRSPYWLLRSFDTPPSIGLLLAALAALTAFAVASPIMMDSGAAVGGGSGNILRQVCYLGVALLALYAIRPLHHPERLLAVPLALVLALGWATLSLSWAIEPGVAVRRLALTALIIWTACVIVRELGYERTLMVVRVVLIVTLLLNYLVVLLFPAVGIHQVDDALDKNLIGCWRGIMTQKNFAGAVCGVTVVFFFFDGRGMPAIIRAAIIAGAAFFLLKSGSRTSLGGCIGGIACGLLYLFYNARYRAFLIPVVVIAVLAVSSLPNFFVDPWNMLLKNQTTLSGRVMIWDMVWRYSMDNRMLGAGYGSFWDIGPHSPAYQYGKGWLWDIASGHNGFLDLLATIGLPGLILVLGATAIVPLTRLMISRKANGPHGALLFAAIVFTLAHNSAESTLFDRDAITWMFMLIAIAMIWTVTPDVSVRRLFSREHLRGRVASPVTRIREVQGTAPPDAAGPPE